MERPRRHGAGVNPHRGTGSAFCCIGYCSCWIDGHRARAPRRGVRALSACVPRLPEFMPMLYGLCTLTQFGSMVDGRNAGQGRRDGGAAAAAPRPPSLRVTATKAKVKAVSALLGGIQGSFSIDAKDIKECQALAAGSFGTVLKGKYGQFDVAIKQMKAAGKQEMDDLKAELTMLFKAASQCNNVCKLHGLTELEGKLSVVMAYYPVRDLLRPCIHYAFCVSASLCRVGTLPTSSRKTEAPQVKSSRSGCWASATECEYAS